ncbi:MAG: polysaccharide deacetylase family protein [Solirubrobacteraceae bacterium]|nr:polysaccharide deacetylase family protein [Solirubrobacteraceae bacterium]
MSQDDEHYGVGRPSSEIPLVHDWQRPPRRPLHLTFDDGPDPTWTPQVLELLALYEATATFFVLGWRMRDHPELIEEILAAGHDVELHGDAHLDHEIASLGDLVADTDAALRLLRAHGVVPQWWRIPFGRPGEHTRALANAHGVRLVGWDIDTFDWRGDGWAEQQPSVRAVAEHGGVVLMHDAVAPGTPRAGAENTLEIVGAILQEATARQTMVIPLPPATLAGSVIPELPRTSPFERSEATMREVQGRQVAPDEAKPPTRRP